MPEVDVGLGKARKTLVTSMVREWQDGDKHTKAQLEIKIRSAMGMCTPQLKATFELMMPDDLKYALARKTRK